MYFSSGGATSFGDLIDRLGAAWNRAEGRRSNRRAARSPTGSSGSSSATPPKERSGDAVGWISGQDTVPGAPRLPHRRRLGGGIPPLEALEPAITMIARLDELADGGDGRGDGPAEAGRRIIVDGIRGLAGMAREAAAGALRTVVEAVQMIGEKLVQWGEEIAARLGGGAAAKERRRSSGAPAETASVEARAVEADVARTVETDVARGDRDDDGRRGGEPGGQGRRASRRKRRCESRGERGAKGGAESGRGGRGDRLRRRGDHGVRRRGRLVPDDAPQALRPRQDEIHVDQGVRDALGGRRRDVLHGRVA